jgi:hypothetical protein
MEVGDLVKVKSTGEIGVIVEFYMRVHIPSSVVMHLGSGESWYADLDDLELVK